MMGLEGDYGLALSGRGPWGRLCQAFMNGSDAGITASLHSVALGGTMPRFHDCGSDAGITASLRSAVIP